MTSSDPNKIAIGDLVRVTDIFSPVMLVTSVSSDGISTMWFNRRSDLQRETFPVTVLFKVPPLKRVAEASTATEGQ